MNYRFDRSSIGAALFGRTRCYDRHAVVDLAISRRHESPSNRSRRPRHFPLSAGEAEVYEGRHGE